LSLVVYTTDIIELKNLTGALRLSGYATGHGLIACNKSFVSLNNWFNNDQDKNKTCKLLINMKKTNRRKFILTSATAGAALTLNAMPLKEKINKYVIMFFSG